MEDSERTRVIVDAPTLGEKVELVEGTIGEILPLMTMGENMADGDNATLALSALAVSLRINGTQLSLADLQKLGARKLKALMALAPKALEVNGFSIKQEAGEEKKS